MKLQTYGECMVNIGLFVTINELDNANDGRFVCKFMDGSLSFRWFEGGSHHRFDGPAYITEYVCYWYFEGEYIGVSSQDEFEVWFLSKI